MKPLNRADLNRLIEVRHPVQSSNGKGGYTSGWSDPPVRVWAEVKGFSNGKRDETQDSGVLNSVFYYRIRVRFREDIAPKDQIRHAGKDLNVTGAYDPDGRREQLVIIADTLAALETI